MIHDDDVAVVTVLLIATKKIVTVAKPEKIPSLSFPLKSNPSPLTPSPLIYAYSSPLKRREDNAHLP